MVEELIAGYAILTVPESEMAVLAETEQIEYVEKPKRLFFADLTGSTAACYAPGSRIYENLTGKGVLVAVIDSGISYWNEDFPCLLCRIITYIQFQRSLPLRLRRVQCQIVCMMHLRFSVVL